MSDENPFSGLFKAGRAVSDSVFGPKAEAISTIESPQSVEPNLTAPQEMQASNQISAQVQNPIATPPVVPSPAPAAIIQPRPIAPAMVPLQTNTQSNSLPPKLIAAANTTEKHALTAQDDAVKAQIAQNDLLAAEQKQRAAMLQKEADDSLAISAERKKFGDQKMADVTTAVQNYNDNSTVNPDRKMQSMGVGGRILATIGQAFGAFGAAITHSPNYAQQMIERAIDADIRAQEHDIAARGQKVNFAQNALAAFRNQGMDEEAARAATRVLRLQQSSAKVDEILANTKNAQTIASGQQIKAGIEKAANDTLMHYGQVQSSTVKGLPGPANNGVQLPAHEAVNLGTANSAIDAAKDLYKTWEKDASGVMGFISSGIPGSDAKVFNDKRQMAKQIIGSYLEGGILRKEDEAKYEQYLPAAGDSENRAKGKRDSLLALIASRQIEQKKALAGAGYNVGNIKENFKPVTTFKPAGQ